MPSNIIKNAFKRRQSQTAIVLFLLIIATLGLLGCSGESGTAAPKHNVVLIVLDTVRADRLSCYGYDRPTTPNIDAIAKQGVRFEHFYSNSGWTLAAHASLFTGLYPVGHRATQETLELSTEVPTLAELLGSAGYQTYAVSANPVVNRPSGLVRGFDVFDEVFRLKVKRDKDKSFAEQNNMAFRRFLMSSDRERPYFAFLNYIEAHAPYEPPEPYRSRFVGDEFSQGEVLEVMDMDLSGHYLIEPFDQERLALANRLYDGEMAHLDARIGELFEIIKRDGRIEETLVVIISDHGENLGDHGFVGHVFSVHNTLLEIPLIVRFPGGSRAGEVRRDRSELLDLFPTILKQCGIKQRGRRVGRDLFAEGAESVDATVFAEYYYPRQVLSVFKPDLLKLDVAERNRRAAKLVPFMRRLRAVQDGKMKLIWGSDDDYELYRIDRDPRETKDIAQDEGSKQALEALLSRLDEMVMNNEGKDAIGPPPPIGWMMPGFEEKVNDPELLKKLKSLGYIK